MSTFRTVKVDVSYEITVCLDRLAVATKAVASLVSASLHCHDNRNQATAITLGGCRNLSTGHEYDHYTNQSGRMIPVL